jgi:hypothetical protein
MEAGTALIMPLIVFPCMVPILEKQSRSQDGTISSWPHLFRLLFGYCLFLQMFIDWIRYHDLHLKSAKSMKIPYITLRRGSCMGKIS